MRIDVASAYQDIAAFIRQLPKMMEEGQGELVYDGRNRVVRFHHNGVSLMVKRFKRVNIIQQMVYTFFRKTKAERAYLYAQEFLRRGIDTPQPVAYMEAYRYGLFTTGYFVCLESEGTETSRLLRDVEVYSVDLVEAVARHVALMHSRGVLHGDLNLTNFLCTQDDEGYHFTMIDINRSHFCKGCPSNGVCLKNLVRLTHRRDLYEDLVRHYAIMRGWDADSTVNKALSLLERFEHRRIKL